MNYPIDHHFIPAFFLAQWADASDKLVEYTIKHGKLIPKPVGPRGTGFESNLYSFPELSPNDAQFIEQVFFNYADRVAADALNNHLAKTPTQWTADLTSAWSRFVIAVHLRHPDAMPELRAAVKSIWDGAAPRIRLNTKQSGSRKTHRRSMNILPCGIRWCQTRCTST